MLVSIIMGSKSDEKIMNAAKLIFDQFNIKYEYKIISAHRTPQKMYEYARETKADIIIAGAGGAAHLPGMVASLTIKPVIGVPIKLKDLAGLDSLLSQVQMPKGVPVATVSIDGAANAALLAIAILAIKDKDLQKKLTSYREEWEK